MAPARNRSIRSPACSWAAVMRMGREDAGSLLADMPTWDNADWIRMGDGMRALKIAVVVMGVLIGVGTTGLVVGIARRLTTPAVSVATWPASAPVVLDEPA